MISPALAVEVAQLLTLRGHPVHDLVGFQRELEAALERLHRRHGVFDVRATGERQTWAAGRLAMVEGPGRRCMMHPPWGTYPDLEAGRETGN